MKKNVINILSIISFLSFCFFAMCTDASASNSKMSSEDLTAVMGRYLDRLVKNDPAGLPISRNIKITENGYPIQLGNGLFQTAEEITYRQYMADPSTNQVMVFGVVKESVLLANFMIRLKVMNDKITEIETIVARKDEASFASPEELKEPRPIYAKVLSESERSPRDVLIRIADSYFEGIEKIPAKWYHFTKTAIVSRTVPRPPIIRTPSRPDAGNSLTIRYTPTSQKSEIDVFCLRMRKKDWYSNRHIRYARKKREFQIFPDPF